MAEPRRLGRLSEPSRRTGQDGHASTLRYPLFLSLVALTG